VPLRFVAIAKAPSDTPPSAVDCFHFSRVRKSPHWILRILKGCALR
jgi:hypothetical protein